MDPSYQYHQQYSTPQPYPPPSAAAAAAAPQAPAPESHYYQQYNQAAQQQQYPYYPPPATTHYYQSGQEPAPIHPPGVSVQSDPTPYDYGQITHDPYQQNLYYPQPGLEQQQHVGYPDPGLQGQQWQGNEAGLIPLYSQQPQSGQLQHNSAGRSGGRGGRGPPIRGRGRGRGGRGGAPAMPRAPPQMAWCELCRVDCNTPEILEKHKSGKKHNKNLKVQQELQTLAQKTQAEAATSALPGNIVGPNEQNPPLLEGQASGLKRKQKSGPANKRKKVNNGSSNPSDLTKPKENVPFICELCNVKCESTVVFDSHLKGKKHLFHLQRFQEHQATLGQAALQALYPALEAALLQALSQQQQQPNLNASTSDGVDAAAAATGLDQQVLQLLQAFLPQAGVPPAIMQNPHDAAVPLPQAGGPPAIAPLQNPQDAAVPSSNLGNGSQNGPTDVGTESQSEPETKIEGPDSMNAQEARDTAA